MTGPVGTTPLYRKLFLKPAMRCLTVGAPTGFFALLEDLPPGIAFETELTGEFDWVMVFAVQYRQVVENIPNVLHLLVEDGLLWVTYPKSSSKLKGDLTRDRLWNVMRSHGYKAVTQVYIDQDWTAMRFRELAFIGK
jgi:hypothetical protein